MMTDATEGDYYLTKCGSEMFAAMVDAEHWSERLRDFDDVDERGDVRPVVLVAHDVHLVVEVEHDAVLATIGQ
jgi:hypothetical protein